jgi:ADP-ribosylation factor family
MQQHVEVTPTIGYKVEKLVMNNFDFTVFDMSGMDTHRELWETQYKSVDVGLTSPGCHIRSGCR